MRLLYYKHGYRQLAPEQILSQIVEWYAHHSSECIQLYAQIYVCRLLVSPQNARIKCRAKSYETHH